MLFWAWLLACLLSVCLAASVAEVASALPTAGAVHFWSYSLASTGSRAGACWASGWLLLAGRVAAAAAAFHGFAYQLAAAVAVAKGEGVMGPGVKLAGNKRGWRLELAVHRIGTCPGKLRQNAKYSHGML